MKPGLIKSAITCLLFCGLTVGQTITVDPNTSLQTITGWEAVGETGREDFADWEDYKVSLMDQAAADGINRIKLNMQMRTERSSSCAVGDSVNDNADPFVIDNAGFCWTRIDAWADAATMLKQRLAAQGEALFILLGYTDFSDGTVGAITHSNDAEEYAELHEAAFIHLNATYGWVPDAIEVILEPDHSLNSNWNATKVVNALLATQSRLAARGWNPRFIVPSLFSGGNFPTWWANMKAVNTTWLQYVDEGSFHRYGSPPDGELDDNQTTAEADGKRYAMLEYATNSNDYTLLHADLKRNAVAWEQFALAYDNNDGGTQYYGINHTSHVVSITTRMKFYRQYFKWVRRGAVRKGSSSNNGNIDGLAFRNVGGNYTVVVKALASGNISVTGIPAGTYHIRYTTGAAFDQNPGDQTIGVGGTVSTSIPAAGVLTVFADAPPLTGAPLGARGLFPLRGRVVIR